MSDEKNIPDSDASDAARADESAPGAAHPVEITASEPVAQSEPAEPADIVEQAEPVASDDDPDVTFDSIGEAFAAVTDGPEGVDPAAPPQYGVGPFSIREVAIGGIWLVAFVVSFFPIYSVGNSASVWTGGIDWILMIGVPTVAVFLLGLRRLSPLGIRRVGSLGIDQFASVAFSVAAVLWLSILWSSFATLAGRQVFFASWVVWVEFVVFLAGVLLTVFAPLFPTIGDDFRHRTEVPAHRFARPTRPVVARPAVERPAPAPVVQADADASLYAEPVQATAIEVEEQPQPAASAAQAFWALAPDERDVVDENGTPLFRVGPTAWALVIEDRGDSFVVRHEDGRVGYLTDVSGITRG